MDTTSARVYLRWIVAALMLHATSSAALARKGNDEPTVDAIWHVQALPLEYRSHDTYYDCGALEQRVRAMLELMGARPPIVVHANCGEAPARQIHVEIVVTTPFLASDENVRAATTYDARDELVARMRQFSLPTAADIERFPAQWRKRHVRLSQGDCDLMRDIHEQIVPKLSVRTTSKKVNCPRISSLRTRMQYEALIAVPSAPQANRG